MGTDPKSLVTKDVNNNACFSSFFINIATPELLLTSLVTSLFGSVPLGKNNTFHGNVYAKTKVTIRPEYIPIQIL